MTALLLAEPEEALRGFLARQLASDGFDVLAFSTPDDLPRAAEPDVLLLGDPAALDRCIVTDCPVIVLGSADPATRVRALQRCDDYLSRPFAYEELVGSISNGPRSLISVTCREFSSLIGLRGGQSLCLVSHKAADTDDIRLSTTDAAGLRVNAGRGLSPSRSR